MSMPSKQTVPCPKCGKDIEYTMWQTITDELPFAIPDVISGKLFDIECKHCGHKDYVIYPILVTNIKHRAMVSYVYPDQTEEAERAFDTAKKYFERHHLKEHFRIVTDQVSLMEKVDIFNSDLDDRIIELLKVYVLIEARDQLADKDILGVYFHAGDDPYFEIVYDDDYEFIPIKMEMYDATKKAFSGREELKQDDEYYVDFDWAWSIYNAKGEG